SPPREPAAAAATEPPPAATRQRPPSARQQSRLERYQEVRRRHAQGQSLQRISRDLGLTWRTARRYAQSDHCPDWRPGRIEPSPVDDYRDRIDAWLAAGHRNVSALHRQLQAEGAAVGYDALRYFVTRRLAARGERRQRLNAVQPPPRPPPSAKGLSFAVIAKPTERTDAQHAQVARLRERSGELAQAVELVEEFAALLRKQSGTTLADWQEKVRSGASGELRRCVEGLQRDQAVVQAAVDQPWSNGMVEGSVNRLKTIKRQRYGRAGLRLLRARVLYADGTPNGTRRRDNPQPSIHQTCG